MKLRADQSAIPKQIPTFSSSLLSPPLRKMQKVLRRNLLSRNQALRNARAKDKRAFKKELVEYHRDLSNREKALGNNVRTERKNRREDWMLGPLAPQRDIGDERAVYGTQSHLALRHPTIPEKERDKYFNFAVGDRAVVTRGPFRGRIGEITAIREHERRVEMKGINEAC